MFTTAILCFGLFLGLSQWLSLVVSVSVSICLCLSVYAFLCSVGSLSVSGP